MLAMILALPRIGEDSQHTLTLGALGHTELVPAVWTVWRRS